ncbi:SDR family mycofactocin-dependent oxidoreductase [Nocardioides sp. zg-579]|uniref:SDR family mycofactocin-dependent oxidoreductase n=1 Tax=Nocardioides marmotae TaxID=2663857 RepID=A0A6I3J975_9ACTN|nr:mycofactocin-coupled SDR family oxidoreductase [Nocardioides marmotae]MCR6030127.1 SDR family mycofactocin-dependent oxidoreductase [Gordonia jinghuaiqii]MTB93758.1 SDR family mycofactocin-dependent oxidoreductase [Nocardioides marmotae]QKE00096.1 SDR family oxidoreductase [Nocardioides marmotae]
MTGGGPTRVALVTGAARGIGAATVRALGDQGYGVTAVDICAGDQSPPGLRYPLASADELASAAAQGGEHVLAVQADVRDAEALERAVAATVERFGRLDAVVAAAGVVVGGQPQWETPTEHLRTLMDINVLGVWNTASAAVPVMLSGPDPSRCRFVAVASAAGERGLFRLAGYTASKHAVVGIVRGLAADLVGTGATAVAVAPGSTRTAMLAGTADLYGTTADALAHHQGIRRLIEPEEVAEVIVLCCSPVGAVLNGSVVRADGGFAG